MPRMLLHANTLDIAANMNDCSYILHGMLFMSPQNPIRNIKGETKLCDVSLKILRKMLYVIDVLIIAV